MVIVLWLLFVVFCHQTSVIKLCIMHHVIKQSYVKRVSEFMMSKFLRDDSLIIKCPFEDALMCECIA